MNPKLTKAAAEAAIPDLVTGESLAAFSTDEKIAEFVNELHRARVASAVRREADQIVLRKANLQQLEKSRKAAAAMRTAIATHLAEFAWMDGPEGWRESCQKLREAAGGTLASPGANLIAAERLRQLTQEGWTPAHDDQHTRAELSGAAACYAIAANELASPRPYLNPPNISLWPWEMKWWKPGNDPVRCLVKAGALIAAEIDRLKRAEDYQRHVDTAAELCAADDKPCAGCLGFGVCDGPSQEGGGA